MDRDVVVIDDEELIRRSLRLALEAEGYRVAVAASGAEGRALLESGPPDCVILDVRLGDANGLELLAEARARTPGLKALVITAHGDVDSAVQALRLGAYDFIRKPFEIEEVVAGVRNALHARSLELRVAYLDDRARLARGGLLYACEPMRRAMAQVEKLASQSVRVVLVKGESGTGKELIARALHAASDHRDGPFVDLNCSALPEQLVESELFGHERGAFSDARERKKGLVELADGGTLFLDEIGDLAAAAQAKLLRFVETREFRRVGGTQTLKVDCRIVAATHRELTDTERFRADLYYRLAGLTIALPPLRERGDDILLLARRFLAESASEYRKALNSFSAATERALLFHPWPGNVRELRAAVSFAAVMAETPVVSVELVQPHAELAETASLSPVSADAVRPLEEVEADYCRTVLALCGGNRGAAAEKLGINRHTLARKVGDGEGK